MKWTPVSSSGRATHPASSSIGMQEVLETSSVPGRTAAETSASTLAFTSVTSVTASITAVASATPASDVLVTSSPRGRSGGSTPISWACRSFALIVSEARAAFSALTSTSSTDRPWPRASAAMLVPITPPPAMARRYPASLVLMSSSLQSGEPFTDGPRGRIGVFFDDREMVSRHLRHGEAAGEQPGGRPAGRLLRPQVQGGHGGLAEAGPVERGVVRRRGEPGVVARRRVHVDGGQDPGAQHGRVLLGQLLADRVGVDEHHPHRGTAGLLQPGGQRLSDEAAGRVAGQHERLAFR